MKAEAPPQKLLDLSPEEQARIVSWIARGPSTARRRILKDFHTEVSEGGLNAFMAWFHVTRHLDFAAVLTQSVQQTFAGRRGLKPADGTLAAAGQVIFEILAVQNQDFERFAVLRKLRQKDRALALAARKVVVQEKQAAFAESLEKTGPPNGLTPAEKEAKLQEYLKLARSDAAEGAGGNAKC